MKTREEIESSRSLGFNHLPETWYEDLVCRRKRKADRLRVFRKTKIEKCPVCDKWSSLKFAKQAGLYIEKEDWDGLNYRIAVCSFECQEQYEDQEYRSWVSVMGGGDYCLGLGEVERICS